MQSCVCRGRSSDEDQRPQADHRSLGRPQARASASAPIHTPIMRIPVIQQCIWLQLRHCVKNIQHMTIYYYHTFGSYMITIHITPTKIHAMHSHPRLCGLSVPSPMTIEPCASQRDVVQTFRLQSPNPRCTRCLLELFGFWSLHVVFFVVQLYPEGEMPPLLSVGKSTSVAVFVSAYTHMD